jgi:hypothetical protein
MRTNIILILLALCFYTCAGEKNIAGTNSNHGAIYGRVFTNTFDKKNTALEVITKDSTYNVHTDSTGVFFIPNARPGKYTITLKFQKDNVCILEDFEVKNDSISFIETYHTQDYRIQKKKWDGHKVKLNDIKKGGEICGKTLDQSGIVLENVFIKIKGTFWNTRSDSFGNFCFDNILPGIYTLTCIKGSYYQSVINEVKVCPEKTSLVNFHMLTGQIPEEPSEIKWVPNYKTN